MVALIPDTDRDVPGRTGAPMAEPVLLGRRFVDAIVAADFGALERLLAEDVRFRALVPRASRDASSAREACELLEGWFGETEDRSLVRSDVETVADRLHVAYRLRLRENGAWYLVEQQLFALQRGGRLVDVALVCSGFRPIAAPIAAPAAAPAAAPDRDRGGGTVARQGDDGDPISVDARLDAVGRSCATLTPEIGAAMRALEPGQVLEIVADDPTAGGDLRAWTGLTGHQLIAVRPGPPPASRFYVRRSERRAAPTPTEGQR